MRRDGPCEVAGRTISELCLFVTILVSFRGVPASYLRLCTKVVSFFARAFFFCAFDKEFVRYLIFNFFYDQYTFDILSERQPSKRPPSLSRRVIARSFGRARAFAAASKRPVRGVRSRTIFTNLYAAFSVSFHLFILKDVLEKKSNKTPIILRVQTLYYNGLGYFACIYKMQGHSSSWL